MSPGIQGMLQQLWAEGSLSLQLKLQELPMSCLPKAAPVAAA